ncbi:hypothetical protein Dda_0095 [Drechslerella dactyloides]|uniref:Calcineurin-like phosphoesterase domain-containing protein n=1 Tax=Drechslerella dactyloides TaxID=74499 RepID=A0AAD6J3X4_DREDA|nr:hypothetical protein Dda_0095 [Drechslerella dactyloides]
MHLVSTIASAVLGLSAATLACDACTGTGDIEMVRRVRLVQPRMQPDALPATVGPKGPLPWGQLTIAHTSDTHGWLLGHVKEANYGADWGDYVSFIRHMRYKARSLGVDFLVLDSGDLHDGAGLSDVTAKFPGGVNGQVSLPIFQNLDYDLLTIGTFPSLRAYKRYIWYRRGPLMDMIGNHELYVNDISHDVFENFARFYNDRYLTSNVQIRDPKDGQFKYIGRTHKYFTTTYGLRIMAFGVLFDFTKNGNDSKIIMAKDMVKQQWFLDAINQPEPIDVFLVLGHTSIRDPVTFPLVLEAIRKVHPNTPVQFFGGHTHRRDFAVYDAASTALEPGQYCESLGWFAMSGINAGKGTRRPHGVPNPTRPALNSSVTSTSDYGYAAEKNKTELVYARRYLDWNRLTFEEHSDNVRSFDTPRGKAVTEKIGEERVRLNLTNIYGCSPRTYCCFCVPQDDPGSVFKLVQDALSTVVVNESRKDVPRMIYVNTGGIRFDVLKGAFTYDDSFTVAPFINTFQYIPNVPFKIATQLLDILNAGPLQKRSLEREQRRSFLSRSADACPLDGAEYTSATVKRRVITRRQQVTTQGYVTSDDFGNDGDDTPHTAVPFFKPTNDIVAKGGFPADNKEPEVVDVVFYDFIQSFMLNALEKAGAKYTKNDVAMYLPKNFSSNNVLPEYARRHWDKNCTIPGLPPHSP